MLKSAGESICKDERDRYRDVVFCGSPKPRLRVPHRKMPVVRRATWAAPADSVQEDVLPPRVAELFHVLLEPAGLRTSDYRAGPLLRRLPACLRALRAASVDEAMVAAQRDPNLASRALDALIIGVTSLYRDQQVFDTLRYRMLPELLDSVRSEGRDGLDVWSVACSDGAELRTVAALLDEAGALEQSRLCGTDCRPGAIEAAKRARYAMGAVRAMPLELMSRHFRLRHGFFEPSGPLASYSFDWRVQDVLSADCPDVPRWDLILCRNIAIYLTASAAGELWRRMAAGLRPGGVLVLGKAERPAGSGWVMVAPCIYRKRAPRGPKVIQG